VMSAAVQPDDISSDVSFLPNLTRECGGCFTGNFLSQNIEGPPQSEPQSCRLLAFYINVTLTVCMIISVNIYYFR
jgi:hypothetical protein